MGHDGGAYDVITIVLKRRMHSMTCIRRARARRIRGRIGSIESVGTFFNMLTRRFRSCYLHAVPCTRTYAPRVRGCANLDNNLTFVKRAA